MPYSQTAIMRVLRSLRGGCETSRRIADDTGVSQNFVCRYLQVWEARGRAERCGRIARHDGRRERKLTRWRAV